MGLLMELTISYKVQLGEFKKYLLKLLAISTLFVTLLPLTSNVEAFGLIFFLLIIIRSVFHVLERLCL